VALLLGHVRRVLVFIYTTAMEVPLTPNGEGLLRAVLARHPGRSPTEVVEQALAERIEREAASELPAMPQPKKLSPEEFDSWLAEFTQFSSQIPPMPGETFSREMIYQDHD